MKHPLNTHRRRIKIDSFFFKASCLILCFVILAFGLKVLVHPERLVRYHMPSVALHAVFMLLWLILFVLQTSLVLKRNIQLHKKLGRVSIFLVLALIISGLFISFNISLEFNRPGLFALNIYMLLSFSLLYASAIFCACGGKIDWHKRLLFIGSLNLLIPAYVRWCDILNTSKSHAEFFHFGVLLLVPLGYDYYKGKKLHPATITAMFISYLIFGLGYIFESQIKDVISTWLL